MRKVFNKWFILAILLTVSLSAFSLIVYRQSLELSPVSGVCSQKPAQPQGEMLWDILSGQFSSVSIQ